ncbi:hypothetical protein MHW47_01275 [Streptomyces sp. OfavH-34-F]|uniref:hypothetical protein n=1 Tax=Streptomyces sp. OfavH-34-F TaxID=2917760 RepID=UPI001EF277F7|nr:hypothetical protein [Streptomyces sp. OfavH-34-F]MCG7523086.1 hypothetical protein [Streptomyces sp. OfavH-34-F]
MNRSVRYQGVTARNGFTGGTALVIGAGGGLGRALAPTLAAGGASVIVTGRTAS